MGSACVITLLAPKTSPAATYSGFLEPFLAGGMGSSTADTTILSGTSSITTSSSATFMQFGAGLRFGAERDGLFSALESNVFYSSTADGSGENVSVGVTAGGDFTYIPIRVFVGFDPVFFNFTGGTATPSFGIRGGISYYLSTESTIGLVVSSYQTEASDTTTSSTVTGRSTSIGLLWSMPFHIEQPKEPWRGRYKTIERSEAQELSETPETLETPETPDSLDALESMETTESPPPSDFPADSPELEESGSGPAISDTPALEEAAPPAPGEETPSIDSLMPPAETAPAIETAPPLDSLSPPSVGGPAAPPPVTPDPSVPAAPEETMPTDPAAGPPPANSGIMDPGGDTPTLEELESAPPSSPSVAAPPTADAPPPPPTEEGAIEMLPTQ